MFNFFKNCHTVFHSGETILHSQPAIHRVPTFSTSWPTYVIFCFCFVFIIAILMGVKFKKIFLTKNTTIGYNYLMNEISLLSSYFYSPKEEEMHKQAFKNLRKQRMRCQHTHYVQTWTHETM